MNLPQFARNGAWKFAGSLPPYDTGSCRHLPEFAA